MPIKLSVFGKRLAHVAETTTGECDKFLAIRAPIPASHTSMGYSSAVLIVALAALAAALTAMAIQRFVGFDVRHQHHNAGSAVFLQLGVVFAVLLAFTVTLALFVALSQIPNRMSAAVISACFAAGIASILVVAKLLDYPFEGALALPPDDFITVIGKVSKLFVS